MFRVHIPLFPVLQIVAHYCRLTYLGPIHEILEDGIHIYGIELQLPTLFDGDTPRTFYFWGPDSSDSVFAYEAAAEEALILLQNLYGFVVQDYNSRNLTLYTELSRTLFRLANRGAQLARFIATTSQRNFVLPPDLIAFAEDLLHDMENI